MAGSLKVLQFDQADQGLSMGERFVAKLLARVKKAAKPLGIKACREISLTPTALGSLTVSGKRVDFKSLRFISHSICDLQRDSFLRDSFFKMRLVFHETRLSDSFMNKPRFKTRLVMETILGASQLTLTGIGGEGDLRNIILQANLHKKKKTCIDHCWKRNFRHVQRA